MIRKRCWLMGAVIWFGAFPAMGTFQVPDLVPIDRVIQNLEARRKENPRDAELHYQLARAHYLSFASRIPQIPAFYDRSDLTPAPDWILPPDSLAMRAEATSRALVQIGVASTEAFTSAQWQAYGKEYQRQLERLTEEHWKPVLMTEKESVLQAEQSMAEFDRAIGMQPDNGLYYLGRASLKKQFLAWRDSRPTSPSLEQAPRLAKVDLVSEMNDFDRAFELARAEDRAHPSLPPSGTFSLVSHEAGLALIGIAEQNPAMIQPARLREARAQVDRLDNKPRGAITPIIFSLDPSARHLDDLLAPDRTATFDLDGTGRDQSWPWVRPTTTFLVWDPAQTGHIRSGRQMFGSVTWWIFFRNGYEALQTLDDNHDGWLTGAEMRGIAAWTDGNGDGVCQSGEVRPLDKLGVTAVATTPSGREGISPMNAAGIRLQDGRIIPSFDWTTKPAGAPAAPLPRDGHGALTPAD